VVQAIDEAALNWGVKVLRYEIKDLTPPKEILHAMQAQITAEREKRALIAASEGRRQEQINIATGEREAFIARSEGEKQAVINKAAGRGGQSITGGGGGHGRRPSSVVAAAIRQPGGEQAVQLKVAEKGSGSLFSRVATDATTTLIVPEQHDRGFGADRFSHENDADHESHLNQRAAGQPLSLSDRHRAAIIRGSGAVDEWFKSHAWKACVG
jgi:regulator of protease activity HflC (stomatin/prohibitin superfamily)